MAIFIDIVRKIYRIFAAAIIRHKEYKEYYESKGYNIETQQQSFDLIRISARRAFRDNLDDLTKFVAFTTVLIIGFFLFPRLKLLSLAVFNLTLLVWDIILPRRAVREAKSDDILSRIIAKVLRL